MSYTELYTKHAVIVKGMAGDESEAGPPPSDSKGPLPPGLDLLWGRRPRGRRGPKPGLSTDAIVETAMAVADADGLEAVSMARIASELGFTTMSLYRYVDSKDELLQLMWNASARGAESLVLKGDDWRSRLRMWVQVQRDVLDKHPWITQMPMASPPMAPNSLTFVERGLESLAGTGLTDDDKIRVIGLLSSYALSEARMANDATRARALAQATTTEQDPAVEWTFEELLRQLVDQERFPLLYGIAWSDVSNGPPDEHQEFLFGVDRILDGVQALIDRSGPQST